MIKKILTISLLSTLSFALNLDGLLQSVKKESAQRNIFRETKASRVYKQ